MSDEPKFGQNKENSDKTKAEFQSLSLQHLKIKLCRLACDIHQTVAKKFGGLNIKLVNV